MLGETCQYCALPVMVLDHAGKALSINRAFELYWHVNPEKVLQQPGYNVFDDPALRAAGFLVEIGLAFRGQAVQIELQEYQFPLQFRANSASYNGKHMITLTAIPFFSNNGQKHVVIIYRSNSLVLNLQNLEHKHTEMMAFNRSFNDFKHAINNPLQLITGNAQLLLGRSKKLPADVTRKLEKIIQNAEKIRVLLRQDTHHTLDSYVSEELGDLADMIEIL